MPGDYHYLDEIDIVVSAYWGTISLSDILDTITRRAQEMPEHHPKASVIDLSYAQWNEITPKYIHQEMERLRPALAPPKVRTVFVAPGDFFYGFARMYALVHVIYGAANVDVVRSWADASKLLEVELGAAEAWAKKRVRMDDTETATTRFPKA